MKRSVLIRIIAAVTVLAAGAQAQYVYETNSGGNITITGYTGPGGQVDIPNTINGLPVTVIDNNAFQYTANMTGVAIPGSVVQIGHNAFFHCYDLANLSLPDSVTKIGNGAFSYCYSLGSVNVPDNVTSLGLAAFSSCTNMTCASVGNGVPEIGQSTFYHCPLTWVTIGSSVTNLGDSAFSQNGFPAQPTLKRIYFRGDAPDTITGAGDEPFSYNNNAIVFYKPERAGWGGTFAGMSTHPWDPVILTDSPTFNFGEGPAGFEFWIHTEGFSITIAFISVVEGYTNLAEGGWIPMQTNHPVGYPNDYHFNDPDWINYTARFYRLDMP